MQDRHPRHPYTSEMLEQDGYVPVYRGKQPASENKVQRPTFLFPVLLGIAGLVLVGGLGSTAFTTYQKNQDVEAEVQARVNAALQEQQNQVAECVNKVFDGNTKQYRR